MKLAENIFHNNAESVLKSAKQNRMFSVKIKSNRFGIF